MNKRFLLIALLTLAIVGAIARLVFVYAHSGRTSSGRITEDQIAEFAAKFGQTNTPAQTVLPPLDLSQPVRLAVGGLGLADNDQNQQLGDLVTAELTGAPGFNLVERQSLNAILRELNLSLNGFVRAKDAVRVGKLLKADWFLLGTEATINGTNSLVIRVVDARTGVMRDAGVVTASQSPAKLAADVAAFVRQSRQNAAIAKTRIYLAIGGFEDLSVNNRQADFPTQMRGYLTATYQGGNVTLLEREYVETLLREVDLDLAGLTDEGGTNPPPPMQSAFWLVTGQYQSYETTNVQVELNLNVQRIFGMAKHFTMRGLQDESMGRQIKAAIDGTMNQNRGIIILTRWSETRAQMALGKELAAGWKMNLYFADSFQQLDEQIASRRHRNAEEAIHAFETALLLEPTNREAKIYLAACLRSATINRIDEARNLYREIIEEPVQDEWTGRAQYALLDSFQPFNFSSPEEKARWFAAAIQHNTNSAADEFYRKNAKSAAEDITIQSGEGDAVELAKKRLMEVIRSVNDSLKKYPDELLGDLGSALGDYQAVFKDKTTGAREMADLLPKLESEFPALSPALAANILQDQVDTNTPVLAEYQKQLEWCLTHPKDMLTPSDFWITAHGDFRWLIDHQQYDLAARTMEGCVIAGEQKGIIQMYDGDQDKIALGYAYMGAERWTNALDIFASFSGRPVMMSMNGPWGPGMQAPVLTGRQADYCRGKIGLPITRDPKEFDIGKVSLPAPSAYAVAEDGLWFATGDQLQHLDFGLRTNLAVKLPINSDVSITTVVVGAQKIWIATDGDGLIEFDKASHQCRRWTVKDGLMMDVIYCAQLSDGKLWIGYGYRNPPGMVDAVRSGTGGGIGFLDLSSHQFTSFTPSLVGEKDARNSQPPRVAVIAIAAGASGDIWFLADIAHNGPGYVLCRFRSKDNIWERFPQVTAGCCLAADDNQVYVGHFRDFSGRSGGPLGLDTFNFRDRQWKSFKAVEGVPPEVINALALDGHDLWAGGMGYIALVDPDQNQIRKIAHIPTQSMGEIQVGGGYVWAQFNGHLHRVPLSSLQ